MYKGIYCLILLLFFSSIVVAQNYYSKTLDSAATYKIRPKSTASFYGVYQGKEGNMGIFRIDSLQQIKIPFAEIKAALKTKYEPGFRDWNLFFADIGFSWPFVGPSVGFHARLRNRYEFAVEGGYYKYGKTRSGDGKMFVKCDVRSLSAMTSLNLWGEKGSFGGIKLKYDYHNYTIDKYVRRKRGMFIEPYSDLRDEKGHQNNITLHLFGEIKVYRQFFLAIHFGPGIGFRKQTITKYSYGEENYDAFILSPPVSYVQSKEIFVFDTGVKLSYRFLNFKKTVSKRKNERS